MIIADMISGALAQIVGYALVAPAPPFPVFVVGQFFNGFGISLQASIFVTRYCRACFSRRNGSTSYRRPTVSLRS